MKIDRKDLVFGVLRKGEAFFNNLEPDDPMRLYAALTTMAVNQKEFLAMLCQVVANVVTRGDELRTDVGASEKRSAKSKVNS